MPKSAIWSDSAGHDTLLQLRGAVLYLYAL